jgi:hypothetical protein
MTFSVPSSTVAFMNELAAALPSAARVIHARRQEERGDILPHMEMSDLIDWFGATYAASQGHGVQADAARRDIDEFLARLEANFEIGDQDLDDLIATSFLEGLSSLTCVDSPAIKALLPRRMSIWYAQACE